MKSLFLEGKNGHKEVMFSPLSVFGWFVIRITQKLLSGFP